VALPIPVVLDTGALIAAEAQSRLLWALYDRAEVEERVLVVSTPVLAQAWRGGGPRQALLSRFLRGCVQDPPSVEVARFAGQLLGRTGKRDVVDAIVVATAISVGAAYIFTSDPDDLDALCKASGVGKPPLLHRV
jgi:predicted nucleic acid-binding protein